MSPNYRGRFAPSPTGPLHFGSLVAALASYLDAKSHQGTWIVRIEDVDGTRCKPEYTKHILKTLESYQLVSDETVVLQSERQALYEGFLDQLKQQGKVFPCNCTRQALQANAGLHPDICPSDTSQAHSWRLKTNHEIYNCQDLIQGLLHFDKDLSDNHPILKRKDGYFSYQLAVVIDDHLQGITHLIRGADLIDTTAQQLHLYSLLGWQAPEMGHIPLIVNQSNEKISKQNHAKAILNGDLATLQRALSYLAIDTSDANNISEALHQAFQLWGRNKLTQQISTPLIEQDLHFI